MDAEFAFSVIDKSPYATVSMVGTDGKPYCVPLSVARVGEKLYFHCAKMGTKTDVLKRNPNVCAVFVGEVVPFADEVKAMYSTSYESAVVVGKAVLLNDDAEKIIGLRAVCQKFTPDNLGFFDIAVSHSLQVTDVWRIDVDQITGKARKRKNH